ncbi:hypothetical protein [Streptococcus sp. CF10-1]|uniref:hypothetical protein n=1 Tax=Streptococcus sp. CF10-1 TaxID=2963162 RepID=UPI0020C8F3D2|nr:hypothetical protein [Streptococcus sp. CF10-1]MCP9082289.1 hypothetical protein [Streptococcus sp. CF10-1]
MAATTRAYLDFNRTLRFHGMPDEQRLEMRNRASKSIKEAILNLLNRDKLCQTDFDSWHHRTCDVLIDCYRSNGIRFTYGHAQKWINMTFKYLYMLEAVTLDFVFPFLHVPIDNIVLERAKKQLCIPRPSQVWSSWGDYAFYLQYQGYLRQRIGKGNPLRWEFHNWLDEIEKGNHHEP